MGVLLGLQVSSSEQPLSRSQCNEVGIDFARLFNIGNAFKWIPLQPQTSYVRGMARGFEDRRKHEQILGIF